MEVLLIWFFGVLVLFVAAFLFPSPAEITAQCIQEFNQKYREVFNDPE